MPLFSSRYSVRTPGARSWLSSGIHPSAMNRLELVPLRPQYVAHRLEKPFCLRRVVRGVVADVDVDGDEPMLGPRMDREMRFGEQHRSGHPGGRKLMETVADNRHSRIA